MGICMTLAYLHGSDVALDKRHRPNANAHAEIISVHNNVYERIQGCGKVCFSSRGPPSDNPPICVKQACFGKKYRYGACVSAMVLLPNDEYTKVMVDVKEGYLSIVFLEHHDQLFCDW